MTPINSNNYELDNKIESWRNELLTALMKISLKKFEIFCRGLLRHVGIDIDATIGGQYVVDGGLEGFGYVTSDAFRTIRAALQVKR